MITEKYRPSTFADVIGQSEAIAKIQHLLARPDFQRGAIWLGGPSGTGKTTLAWLIAHAKCDDFDVTLMPGVRCNAEAVRKLETDFQLSSWSESGWKAVIVDEAHGMTAVAVQEWLCFLENLPSKRLVIFTSTENLNGQLFGNFSSPFERRVKRFDLRSDESNFEDFATYASKIARTENLNGRPIEAYRQLIRDCNGNLGLALQKIDAGEMLKGRNLADLERMTVVELRKLAGENNLMTDVQRAVASKAVLIEELCK